MFLDKHRFGQAHFEHNNHLQLGVILGFIENGKIEEKTLVMKMRNSTNYLIKETKLVY